MRAIRRVVLTRRLGARWMIHWNDAGRVWLRGAVDPDGVVNLLGALPPIEKAGHRLNLRGPLADALRSSGALGAIRARWHGAVPARAVLFDKSSTANWGLPWHQDRVIALRNRIDVPGFSNWTQKDGVWHCEPPLEVLASMLFVRIHLDPSTLETGAMEIALGSHVKGLIASSDAEDIAATLPKERTEARAGDILALSMLTLHRSRPATQPARRRVLRVNFATTPLPAPLEWA